MAPEKVRFLNKHLGHLFEKIWYLIKKCEKNGLENLKDPKAFTKYSSSMKDEGYL